MKSIHLLYLTLAALIIGCGSIPKKATIANTNAKKSGIIKAHKAAQPDFKTMKSKLSVNYKDNNQSRNVTIDLRVNKGKQIWMSAKLLGITIAKVSITPDQVQFYEKYKNTSFQGDFEFISTYLGEPLTYKQLENLLLGQAVESLQPLEFEITNNQYQFKQQATITKLFSIRPSDFKLNQQSITKQTNQSLIIDYPSYQTIDNQLIPESILVQANKQNTQSLIHIKYKNTKFNLDLSFPFSIPSNSKPIQL